MTDHKVGTPEEWLAARTELLEREKELTRRSAERHDVTMFCSSRALLEKLQAYKRRMGWHFPWVSSLPPEYLREAPGMSAFALADGVVYHTYSAYARGLDGLWGLSQWLDRAPKGRNEGDPPQLWMRRHDEYENAAGGAR
jgi:predicted dithiol-disulfide oxidoreductase (DUF899 family)